SADRVGARSHPATTQSPERVPTLLLLAIARRLIDQKLLPTAASARPLTSSPKVVGLSSSISKPSRLDASRNALSRPSPGACTFCSKSRVRAWIGLGSLFHYGLRLIAVGRKVRFGLSREE